MVTGLSAEVCWLGMCWLGKVLPDRSKGKFVGLSVLVYDDIAKQYSLHCRTNIKNYDNESEKFLDWIKPYIAQGSGLRDFYAVVMYEEASEPAIYYLND